MLSLTQTTGYAIKALGSLSEAPNRSRQTADVALSSGVPKPYLIKIIQSLARQGLVVAKRGIGGGIALARSPEQISLLQVVEAVEGQGWLGHCLLGFDECSNLAGCPTHALWQRVCRDITEELHKTSLASVIEFKARCRKVRPQKAKPSRQATTRSIGRETV